MTLMFRAAAAILLLISLPAFGAGDPAAGQAKSAICAACHGVDGISRWPDVPNIAGLPEVVIANALYDYRGHARPCRKSVCSEEGACPDQSMCDIAEPMSDGHMDTLARFYAARPFGAAVNEYDPDLAEQGRAVHDRSCESCHSKGGSDPADEASILRAQASVEFSRAELRRLEKLAEKSHAAQSRLDQVRLDLAVARSELSVARARTSRSREKLERTSIRAPFNGVVTERFIQTGEWADAGTAVVRLVDTTALEVQAWVPVVMLPYIQSGMVLDFSANVTEGSGRVRTLVPVGDRQSRLYEVRLAVDADGWSSGQGVRISIPTAESRTATVVPRDALVMRRDGITVFRITADNTVEQVSVTTGIASGENIEITGGIRPGDAVVIRGNERLREGQAVQPSEMLPGA